MELLCKCGHRRSGHYDYTQFDILCAESDELCCPCVMFISWKGDVCYCSHHSFDHSFQRTPIEHCEGTKRLWCKCQDFDVIRVGTKVAYAA